MRHVGTYVRVHECRLTKSSICSEVDEKIHVPEAQEGNRLKSSYLVNQRMVDVSEEEDATNTMVEVNYSVDDSEVFEDAPDVDFSQQKKS